MKSIGAAVFLIFSAHWALASDLDLPRLKYDQREPGSLPSAPTSGNKPYHVVSDASDVQLTASGGMILFGVKVESLSMGQEKIAAGVSGGLPLSRTLDLTGDRSYRRAARDYSLITRLPLKAKTPSESSSLLP